MRAASADDRTRAAGGKLPAALSTLPLVFAAAALAHRDALARPLDGMVDLRCYLDAGERALAGRNPYGAVGYFYTPAFAYGVGWLHHGLGTPGTLLAFRLAALLGVWLVATLSLAGAAASLRTRAAVALLVAVSPLVRDGLFHGNATLLLAGPLLAGLLLVGARPAAGGLLVGAVTAMKPMGITAGILAATPRRGIDGWQLPRRALLAATVAVLPWLMFGWRWLPAMGGATGAPPAGFNNIAVAVGLAALGLEVPPLVVMVAVTAVGAWVVWRYAPNHRARVAVAAALNVVALPVNNPSTFLLTLPVQVLALERTWRRWRRPRVEAGASRVRSLGPFVICLAAVLSVHGVRGVRSTGDQPLALRGVATLMPFLAVLLLTALALRVAPEPEDGDAGAPGADG
ncbi:MAG TPA: glycosyltransferase 87 family protein [Thermoanaerobaculia bacterium]|nr:glycosyltransferase 87 family protein [Thermoanaerobaculia bacterium]